MGKKEFGKNVDFIYMSPPWKSQNMGFLFFWLPFHQFNKIRKVMDAKGYTYVDSVGAMLTHFDGRISCEARNPAADKTSSDPEQMVGRMSGNCVKGVLWKYTTGSKG